ncbi:MAG: hypothetical protein IH840_03775 [Candidatus Heimdallarchaeota archaeon]|nr:hypothetical protein [Candidatus Heimdallarchaeota archaeon]
MSVVSKNPELYPISILNELIRPFNAVVGRKVITLKSSSIEINFPNRGGDNQLIISKLIQKLASAFKSINVKYKLNLDKKRNIRMTIVMSDKIHILSIRGILLIPPGKLFNLLSVILWYYITYTTGHRPGNSTFGINLTNAWKQEFTEIQREINRLPRKVKYNYDAKPCHICGEETNTENIWRFIKSSSLSLRTRVCLNHRQLLI